MTTQPSTSDFPIPPDLQGFWQWDKLHCPRPQTTLTQDLFNGSVSAGFSSAMDEFACPVGVQYTNINTYGYMAIVPFELVNETMDERVARYQSKLHEILPRLGELWENEWLPSILPGLERARSTDYASLGDQQLISTLEQMQQELTDRYNVHGKINFVLISASMFVDFYNETFSPEDPTEAYEALQGFHTISVDAGRGLWKLGRIVRQSQALQQLFKQHEPSTLLAEMERSDEGRSFLSELTTYLDEYGWRTEAFELADETWRENPAIPLNTIQGYMGLGDGDDPDIRQRGATERREQLLADARQRLSDQPEKLAQFNQLYETARPFASITENHNFYIDQIGNTVLRLPILEIGRRLVTKGAIDEVNDVFHLFLDDIRGGMVGANFKQQVAERKAEISKWSRVVPMPTIGEPPPHNDDPLGAAFAKLFGVPPEPSRDPDIIIGLGASPGTVQGTAKVVRTLDEASKLEKGDIMVCEMTMPPWTPLFSTVGAVVADTGGPLSHCAIVSREYRLPCVVGTIIGTSVIKDGMILTVDGAKGIVRIESRG